MFRPQPVADVGLTALEHGVLVDKVFVDPICRDDVVGDGIENCEIGLRREHNLNVREIEGAVLQGR